MVDAGATPDGRAMRLGGSGRGWGIVGAADPRVLFALVLALALAPGVAGATPLLANGDFEQGLTGWSREGISYFGVAGLQQRGSFSEWHAYDANDPGAPWYDAPSGILPAGGAAMGSYWADGPVLGLLYQDFTVAAPGATVMVSFDFYTEAGPEPLWACGFDMDCAAADTGFQPGELFRVDLVRGDVDAFSTVPGEFLSLLDGTDAFVFPSVPYPYLHAEFDVSDFVAAGGDFVLRFAGYGGELTHVDNASVEWVVPAPGSGSLLALAVGTALAASRRPRSQAAALRSPARRDPA